MIHYIGKIFGIVIATLFFIHPSIVFGAPEIPYTISDGTEGGGAVTGDILYQFTNTNAGFGTTGIWEVGTDHRINIDVFISGSANNPPGTAFRIYSLATLASLPGPGTYTLFFCSGPYGGPGTDCFDGTWTYADASTNSGGQLTFYWDGSLPEPSDENLSTHIETVTPYNGEILATSTTHTIGSTGRISDEDFKDENSYLKIHLENSAVSYEQCTSVICSDLARNAIRRDFSYELTTASPYTYSSTTQGLPVGKYWVTTQIKVGDWCLFGICATTRTLVASSTTFVISTTTKADDLKDNATEYLNTLTEGGTTFDDCSVTSFDFFTCMSDLITYAFVPTPDAIAYMTSSLHDQILVKFPIGYITDFVSIISTSTVGSLVVFNATVPNGIPGTGSTITLDLTGVLDPYLNATTSQFTNASASSTDTLFEITNEYWKKILYILAFFYMLSRILGSSLIKKQT